MAYMGCLVGMLIFLFYSFTKIFESPLKIARLMCKSCILKELRKMKRNNDRELKERLKNLFR